jgi:hypothetical protein
MFIDGNATNLRFRTIRALPLIESYLVDPAFETNGQKITFHGKIRNGHYMESTPGSRAVVYDAIGNEVSEMQPDVPPFHTPHGNAMLKFSEANKSKNPASVRITLCTHSNE